MPTPDESQLTAPPHTEERTGPQQAGTGSGGLSLLFGAEPGAGRVEPSTFATYRRMRRNPTIAMSRVVSTAPIKRAWFTVKAGDGVPEAQRQWCEDQITPHWRGLIGNSLNALDYGYQAFELVMQMDGARWGLKKFKPLWPDHTEILIDESTGGYAGLKQGKVTLQPGETFRYSYDVEGTNWYGRSRHENVRETSWRWWMDTSNKMAQYGAKVAGVLPIIMYPEGQSKDASGRQVDNFQAANALLGRLNQLKGIVMPNVFAGYARDLIERGVDIKQLRPWLFDFYEAKGQHGSDFVAMLNYHDKQLSRGWLTPERSFQEGVTGTKADAEVGGDLVLSLADELYWEIVQTISKYVIDRLCVLNFPDYTPGDVYLEPIPIINEERALFKGVIDKLLSGPALAELLPLLHLEDLLDSVGIPVVNESDREEPIVGDPPVSDTTPQEGDDPMPNVDRKTPDDDANANA